MNMEGEINNFIVVWTIAAATMCYCHVIGKLVPQGKIRLLIILPAIIILLLLPIRLTSIHLGGPTSFFLGWLSTFKLLLFAFGKGPLFSNPPLALSHFVLLSCFPIKFQHPPNPSGTKNNQNTIKALKLTSNYFYAIMVVGLASLIPLYGKAEYLHTKFILFLYNIHMYIGLEFIFALASLFTQKLLRADLETQFNEPYLCTSLQDFWGRRWNLMVNSILHPSVYDPVVSSSARVIGRRWAPLPAILVTFVVSGLMHELVFYYIKREKRTWEVWEPSWDSLCFFLLHGVCLKIELALKKALKGKSQLPRLLSWSLTVVFIFYTTLWLFVPALVRCRVYDKAIKELNASIKFGKDFYDVLRSTYFHMTNK